MSLDTVRQAKERGWRVILKPNEDNDMQAFHFLVSPAGTTLEVSEREGYGITWGDYTEQEAWARLPVIV